MNTPQKYGDTIVTTTKELLEQDVREFTFHIPSMKLRVSFYSTGMAAPFTMDEMSEFLSMVKSEMVKVAYENN